MNQAQPNEWKLEQSRAIVHTFLRKKARWTKGTFYAAIVLEGIFFLLLLGLMDYYDRFHWFLVSGFLLVYTPLVTLTWHNSIKLDHLYFRLIEELKYRDLPEENP